MTSNNRLWRNFYDHVRQMTKMFKSNATSDVNAALVLTVKVETWAPKVSISVLTKV